MKTNFRSTLMKFGSVLLIAGLLQIVAFMTWPAPPALGQVGLVLPNVSSTQATIVKWTAGTVNNGGTSVTVATGTAALSSGRTNCSAPTYALCNTVYANSSGTVSVAAGSNGIATAVAAGNTILAYVETNASGTATRIVYPQQASTATSVVSGVTATDCGTVKACTSTIRGNSAKMIFGSVVLAGGSALVDPISPAFTSNLSYQCSASVVTAAGTTATASVNITSGTGFAVYTNGASDATIAYTCIGY